MPLGVVTSVTNSLQFSLTSALTADPPVFTLACVSTGGPATTVTWTRDGAAVSYDANHVLTQTVTDQFTATYSNVLTVTGREPGSYQCSVSNDRTAQPAIASLTVAGEAHSMERLAGTDPRYIYCRGGPRMPRNCLGGGGSISMHNYI